MATPSYLTTNVYPPGLGPKPPDFSDDLGNLVQISLPIGSILRYAGTSLPTNFLWCDGSDYSSSLDSTTSNLFKVIGGTYGFTATTFSVPDLRSTFPIGSALTNTMGVTYNSVNSVYGGSSTISTAQMPLHLHAGGSHFHSMATHTHLGPDHVHSLQNHIHSMQTHTHSMQDHTHGQPKHSHGPGFTSPNTPNPQFLMYDNEGKGGRLSAPSSGTGKLIYYTTDTSYGGGDNTKVPYSNDTGGSGTAATGTPVADITGKSGTAATGTSSPDITGNAGVNTLYTGGNNQYINKFCALNHIIKFA